MPHIRYIGTSIARFISSRIVCYYGRMKTNAGKVLGVIPARLNSTRLPRKMLIDIGGKPLLYYTWKQAQKAKKLDALVIATDSKEIKDVAESFGATVLMTPRSIKCGSDRVAHALSQFKDFAPSIVLNIQGDEPLLPAKAIDHVVTALQKNIDAVVATPATPFKDSRDVNTPDFVKVVADMHGRALYFSRSVLPFPRAEYTKPFLKHLGLYGFRADFLKKYVTMKQTPLEKAEKLEQLRILENGYAIQIVPGTYNTMEVNTPRELAIAKKMILKK